MEKAQLEIVKIPRRLKACGGFSVRAVPDIIRPLVTIRI